MKGVLITAAALMLTAAGCVVDDHRPEASHGELDASPTAISSAQTDRALHEEIHEALHTDPDIDSSDINVRVEAGNVWLSGTVEDEEERQAAHDLIHRIEGARAVYFDELRARR